MKKAIIGLAFVLTACASDIMQAYVGRDITAVIATYGPPYRQFDVPGGATAFQWRLSETNVKPHETTYVEDQNGKRITGSIITYDSYVTNKTCYYTFYTQSVGASSRITGFEKPSFDCE